MRTYANMLNTYCYILIFVCVCGNVIESSKKDENNGCSAVKVAYGLKGFSQIEVPLKMAWGNNLRVCSNGLTCCTPEMEQKLERKSNEDFNKVLVDKISQMRTAFIVRTSKFDAFFGDLLEVAKKDLHDMFVRTYGLLYQQNSQVFTTLFDDLRQYYRGSDLNLIDVVDGFFTTLLQKLFVLLHQQSTFDEAYLQCMSEHMDELKPFGMIPQRLGSQVKRAFVAARTFVQALSVGRDVIIEVSKIEPTSTCRTAVMKLQYCSYCRDLAAVRPCNNYCMNVMRGCLSTFADLNDEWNNYIDQLLKLVERLEGPFNIETVIDPIDVKISEAIMNFQENSESVSTKVFQGCGQPKRPRLKRELNYEDQSNGWKPDRKQPPAARPTTAAGTSLDRLLLDMKQQAQLAKDFWKNLPHSVCNDMAAAPHDDQNCWNGSGKAKYASALVGDGTVNQASNPEVAVVTMHSNTVINSQILQLKLVTNKLKSAYNGLDVDSIDMGDTEEESGSGSGFGSSGDGPPRRPSVDIDFSGPLGRTTNPPPEISKTPVVTRPPSGSGNVGRHGNNGNNAGSKIQPLRLDYIILMIFTAVTRVAFLTY